MYPTPGAADIADEEAADSKHSTLWDLFTNLIITPLWNRRSLFSI